MRPPALSVRRSTRCASLRCVPGAHPGHEESPRGPKPRFSGSSMSIMLPKPTQWPISKTSMSPSLGFIIDFYHSRMQSQQNPMRIPPTLGINSPRLHPGRAVIPGRPPNSTAPQQGGESPGEPGHRWVPVIWGSWCRDGSDRCDFKGFSSTWLQ